MPASVQILFGVHDESDPAMDVVRALQAKYPHMDTAIVADTALYGANAKISNLINMLPSKRSMTRWSCRTATSPWAPNGWPR